MQECICNSCRNLKAVLSEEGKPEEYQCRFGLPSKKCEDCCEEGCDETCAHYETDSGEDSFIAVRCGGCGKEMHQALENSEDGEIFCFECYFNRK